MNRLFSKIDVSRIVSDHISTLRDYGGSRVYAFDTLLFFFIPLTVNVAMIGLGIRLTNEFSSLLITVFSIFAALLFNLQILMFNVVGKVSNTENFPVEIVTQQSLDRRTILLEALSFNISFEVLLCVSGVLILAISTLFKNLRLQSISSLVTFYLVILFSLTLAMVLRRTHGLINDELTIQRSVIHHRYK